MTSYRAIIILASLVLSISPISMAADTYTRITAPANGASYATGSNITVNVDARDKDGVDVARLWVDNQYYAMDNKAPYSFSITGLAVGNHSLMVRTKDKKGNELDSQTVAITVQAPQPYTTITSPASGTQVLLGELVTVTVNAYDADGLDSARLWIDDAYHSLDASAPFSFAVSDLTEGSHSLYVRSKDMKGNMLDSARVLVSVVKPAPAATAAITAPAANAVFQAGQPITVHADASDPDGINVVRLWIDNTYHSLDSSAPYEYSVTNLSPGFHSLYVTSKDTRGNLLNSPTISIAVLSSDSGGGNTGGGTGGNSGGGSGNAGGGAADEKISLPIEVLGPAGTKKTVDFTVSDPSAISHLYLRCNACGYHDIDLDKNASKTKATVRVNGGSAIPLKHFVENGRVYGNSQIKIMGGEADYGGIGGGFRTVRLMVPISGLKKGQNTLTFEHLNAEAPSLGFRILELNLLQNGDINRKVLGDADFVNDNPDEWTPPRNTSKDIAQGEVLWQQRNKLYDAWLDGLDGRGNGQGALNGRIQAACSDCHTSDGRDLKYFNFSNLVIIERSKFHGLTQTEGEQIASYIRQLRQPIVPQARPWNPAYQPGPGLDSQPAYEWAAGAGVDAILDRDRDMAPFLFPRGTSLDAVRAVVDRYKTLNLRELPINIPMPEWNQWLPVIHPDDAFNTSASAIVSDANGRNVGKPYYKKILSDALANPNPTTLGGFSAGIKDWLRRGQTCSTAGLDTGEPMRGLNGAVLGSLRLPSPAVTTSNCNSIRNSPSLENLEYAKRGLTAWAAVKMWEVIHGNDLEEESQSMNRPVCSAGRCINAGETRGWLADGRNLFDRPPHFTGIGEGRKYFSQNALQGILESNAWYHLNMILNPGYRQTMPSHFAYTYSHVELLQAESNVDQGYRFWATLIKQRQLQTNGRYGVEEGLDLRTAQPYIYYGTARNKTNTDTQGSVGQPLWGRLAQAMVEDFVEDADNATANDWASATQNRKVQDRNSTDFSPCSGVCTFDLGAYQGRNTYRVIPELRKIGVAESAIQDLIDWAQKTWPRGPWSRVR